MDRRIAANRSIWDEWAKINAVSQFYDNAAFRAGKNSLKHIELSEVGDVAGKSLLHLQCHFGQDTLSWARLGARVTGVDLSPKAIELAQRLATDLDIDAHFVCADVLDLGELDGRLYDIIFVSYGALIWLPDLGPWARTIYQHLKPGGCFHLVEFHPIISLLDDNAKEITGSYFNNGAGTRYEATSSYAGGEHAPMQCFEWVHGVGEVAQTLIDAGLAIRSLKEYPYCVHNCWDFLVESEPGRYVVRHYPGKLPLLYSISATKAL